MENIDHHQQIATHYNLSPAQKFQHLHNLLGKDSKRFYLERVAGYAQFFHQAVYIVNRQYNSPARQTRVMNYLSSLRIADFMKQGNETSAPLAKLYNLITNLSRQVPASHRGDVHKIEYLRSSCIR